MHNYNRNQGPKTFNDIKFKIKNKYFLFTAERLWITF